MSDSEYVTWCECEQCALIRHELEPLITSHGDGEGGAQPQPQTSVQYETLRGLLSKCEDIIGWWCDSWNDRTSENNEAFQRQLYDKSQPILEALAEINDSAAHREGKK
jgi:hypothetical protein